MEMMQNTAQDVTCEASPVYIQKLLRPHAVVKPAFSPNLKASCESRCALSVKYKAERTSLLSGSQ